MAMSGPQPATAEAYVAARPSAQSGSSGDPCQMARRGRCCLPSAALTQCLLPSSLTLTGERLVREIMVPELVLDPSRSVAARPAEVRGDGVPMPHWFVVRLALRLDHSLDTFKIEVANRGSVVPDIEAGDASVTGLPGDCCDEGRGWFGEQPEAVAPVLPDLTRSCYRLDEHDESLPKAVLTMILVLGPNRLSCDGPGRAPSRRRRPGRDTARG
jgi:hypothetical protein